MWLIGDSSAPRAFGYVPDVVAGLAALGTTPGVDRQVFLFPAVTVAPAELVARFAAALGGGRARTIPAWLVRALGVLVPLLGELRETLYQWDRPFLVDDRAWRARFPHVATSLDHAVRDTVATLERAATPAPA